MGGLLPHVSSAEKSLKSGPKLHRSKCSVFDLNLPFSPLKKDPRGEGYFSQKNAIKIWRVFGGQKEIRPSEATSRLCIGAGFATGLRLC